MMKLNFGMRMCMVALQSDKEKTTQILDFIHTKIEEKAKEGRMIFSVSQYSDEWEKVNANHDVPQVVVDILHIEGINVTPDKLNNTINFEWGHHANLLFTTFTLETLTLEE